MRTQIRSDASSCWTVANLDARDFWWAVSGFGQFFIVSGVLKNCLAPSQNSNVWPPNIHVWTHFEHIFPSSVHGWIQKTVSQLAGERVCRGKRQLSFKVVGCLYTDVGTASPANSHKPGPFYSSAATLARFFHVEIFCLVDESNFKFARHIAFCAWSAVKLFTRQV